MAQVINTNIMSLNAQRNLNQTNSAMSQSIERLSSGLRINSAADDAAGLAISERFTSQIKGMDQAIRNANDGLSFAQTAEGALDEVGNMAQRIRELAVQSANDSNSQSDREAINQEVQSLIDEVNRISDSTQFNGQNILDGSSGQLKFQVGANQGQTIEVSGVDARASSLGAVTQETGGLDANAGVFENNGTSDGVVLTSSTSGLADGDQFSVNGVTFTYEATATDVDTGAGTFNTVDDLVDAVNRSTTDSGVQAVKDESLEVNLGSVTVSATTAQTLTLNGQTFDIGSNNLGSADEVASAINSSQLQTDGITASVNGDDQLVLTSSNGDSIDLQYDNSAGNSTIDGLYAAAAVDTTFEAGFELQTEAGQTIDVQNVTNTPISDDNINMQTGTGNETSRTLNNLSVETQTDAADAITAMDFVISQVSSIRSELGAAQNRMESTISNLEVGSENLNAARSRIQDADFAKESSELTRNQVLQQAGTSMLAQANQLPQNALSLLQ